jgi:hypothetical protein
MPEATTLTTLIWKKDTTTFSMTQQKRNFGHQEVPYTLPKKY